MDAFCFFADSFSVGFRLIVNIGGVFFLGSLVQNGFFLNGYSGGINVVISIILIRFHIILIPRTSHSVIKFIQGGYMQGSFLKNIQSSHISFLRFIQSSYI